MGVEATAAVPGAVRSELRALGVVGVALILAICVATVLTGVSDPVLNTSGQLLLKLACLAAILVGLWRYRPRNPWFWWGQAGYFVFASLRNIPRVLTAIHEGHFTFLTNAMWELGCNAFAAACMGASAILLLRSRRSRGNWAVADGWVLGCALMLTMVSLTTIPLLRAHGFDTVFWNVGVLSVIRDCLVLMPIIAFAYSERIRASATTAVCAGLSVLFLSSLAYHAVGANLPNTPLLSEPAVLALGGAQSLGQLMIAAVALMPMMRDVTVEVESERPMWGTARTVVMCAAAIAPLIAVSARVPLQGREPLLFLAGFAGLLVALVLRMRVAVMAANRSINEVSFLALHDPLTGLQNRRSLYQATIPMLADRVEQDGKVRLSCYYLDVDDLKGVNDRTSHAAGDSLLTEMAHAVSEAMPTDSTHVVRFGGDEFLALTVLSGADPEGESIRLGGQLSAAVNGGGADDNAMELRASIGASWTTLRPSAGTTELQVRHLIHEADLAQVAAKQAGGRRIRFYDHSLGLLATRRRVVADTVDSAWARGQMTLAYQPVVALADHSIYGAESLLRWTHPEIGAVPAPEAIRAAEDVGVIDQLGLQILDRALHDLSSLQAGQARVGVNLSAQQLRPESIDLLLEHITNTGLAGSLWLEVTEQMLIEERAYAAGALNDLRECGVVVAIDDFGTGYCGLDYLCTLPVDIVKLDGIFAQHADSSTRQRVARIGAQLADAIGAETLAEGIESLEVATMMRDLGFQYGQGYAFRRPGPNLEDALRDLPTPG